MRFSTGLVSERVGDGGVDLRPVEGGGQDRVDLSIFTRIWHSPPELRMCIRTPVSPSAAGTMPLRMAYTPTPARMLPQF